MKCRYCDVEVSTRQEWVGVQYRSLVVHVIHPEPKCPTLKERADKGFYSTDVK